MPSDEYRFMLFKQIEDKTLIKIGFNSRQCQQATVPQTTDWTWKLSTKSAAERPRYLILGFQSAVSTQLLNTALFVINSDPSTVTNVVVSLNEQKYPDSEYHLNFTNDNYARVFADAAAFRSQSMNIGNIPQTVTLTQLTISDFILDSFLIYLKKTQY